MIGFWVGLWLKFNGQGPSHGQQVDRQVKESFMWNWFGHKYPKAGEVKTVKSLASSVDGLRSESRAYCRALEGARDATARERDVLWSSAAGHFEALGKLAASGEGFELDGTGWVRLDGLRLGKLGLAALASKDRLDRAEAAQIAQSMEPDEASRRQALEASQAQSETLRQSAVESAQRHASFQKGRKELERWLNVVFAGDGAALNADEAQKRFAKSSWWGKAFNTENHRKTLAWQGLADCGQDVEALRQGLVEGAKQAAQAQRAWDACQKDMKEGGIWVAQLESARQRAVKVSPWLDAGVAVKAADVLGHAKNQGLEAALEALASMAPQGAASARQAHQDALAAQAMELSMTGLERELALARENQEEIQTLAAKLESGSRRAPHSKASVGWDMGALAKGFEERIKQLAQLRKDAPILSARWSVSSSSFAAPKDVSSNLAAKASAKFGPDSAPARALTSNPQGSTASEGQGMFFMASALFWSSLLADDKGAAMGSESFEHATCALGDQGSLGHQSATVESGFSASSERASAACYSSSCSSSSSSYSSSCSSSSSSSSSSSCSSSSSSSCSSSSSSSSCSSSSSSSCSSSP
jgi:hypothetical protein